MTDPYLEILGIPPQYRPPSPHQLLGVATDEANSEVIQAAAQLRLARLRPLVCPLPGDEWRDERVYRSTPRQSEGAHDPDIADIMAEIIVARDMLLGSLARPTAEAVAQPENASWWKPEEPPAAPAFPTVSPAGWWQDESSAAATKAGASASDLAETPSTRPPSEPAPSPNAAITPGWWQDSGAQTGPTAPPTAVSMADGQPPVTPPAPAPPVVPSWWAEEQKAPPPPAAPPAPGWWKDAVPATSPSAPMSVKKNEAASMPRQQPLPIEPKPITLPQPAAPPARSAPSNPVLELAGALPDNDDFDGHSKATSRQTKSSPVPWIILSLLVITGGAAFGAWYFLQRPKPFGPEVAMNHENTSPTVQDLAKSAPQRKIEKPVKKPDEVPVNKDPIMEIVDPNPSIDPEPMKKEAPTPPVKTPKAFEPATYRIHKGMVLGIGLGAEAKTFLTTSDDKNVSICSLEKGDHSVIHRLTSEGVAVAVCGGNKTGIFCDGGMIVVYDLVKQNVLANFENPRGGIECLAAAPDGSFVLTGATDGCVRIWNIAGKNLLHTLDVDAKNSVTSVAVAPDGSRAAFGTAAGQIGLWNLAGPPRIIRNWKGHGRRVTVLSFAPDGKRFASFGDDGAGQVWEASNGSAVSKLTGHKGPILGASWCADSRRILSAGVDQRVRLWTAATGKANEWSPGTKEKVYCLAVDSRDRFVLVGESGGIVELLPLPRDQNSDPDSQ